MTHLQREIERLKRKILALGALVEENLRLAVQAIETRDAAKARKVIAADMEVDEVEVEVEEECLKLLALYQPVAKDLRFIVAVVKINSELERIGDLAANVAERAEQLADEYPVPVPRSLPVIADRTRCILEKVLDALVHQDAVAARKLLAADDEVDALYKKLLEELKDGAARRLRPPRRDRAAVQRGALHGASRRPRQQHRRGRALHGRRRDPAPSVPRHAGRAARPERRGRGG